VPCPGGNGARVCCTVLSSLSFFGGGGFCWVVSVETAGGWLGTLVVTLEIAMSQILKAQIFGADPGLLRCEPDAMAPTRRKLKR
jgi:hypothetical protein